MVHTVSLQERNALITGAGRGIGRAIAQGFAESGAKVACVARTESQIATVASQIQADGGSAIARVCDISRQDKVEAMYHEVAKALGGIDIVVLNAGIELEKSSVADSDPELWAEVLNTNLIGTYFCARASVPYLKARGGGKIITVGSGMGHKGVAGSSAYCVSKAGMWMLTRVLAQEVWADGITVNELIPGPVDTDMTQWVAGQPEGKPAAWASEWFKQPEEVVPLALFMASQPRKGPTAQSFSLMSRDN